MSVPMPMASSAGLRSWAFSFSCHPMVLYILFEKKWVSRMGLCVAVTTSGNGKPSQKKKKKKNQPEGTKKYICSCKGPKTKTKLDGVKKPVIL